MTLPARITAINDTEIDVVIIGAGINGAGLFRDLCEQGVRCLIVDKGDYGSGTSAAPSRLIHGGLKYLETGEFGLVAQSTLERNLLLKNAPHTVTPLPTVIPIFSWTKGIWPALRTLFGATSAPRSRGALLIKAGLMIYDFYGARHRVMPRHTMVGRKRALRETRGLTDRIVAAGTYYDAKVSQPERLVFELMSDGLAANAQSAALNYTDLAPATDGTLTFSRFGETFCVRPKIVINAAGPWIDTVNATLGAPSKMIGGTKGSHILLRNEALIKSLNGRMIYFEADDGRICLVYDHLGLAMVGSTDIPADNPDEVACEPDEVAYMLESVRALMPGIEISHDQIVYAYSGIRPLPASDATNPGLISRDHSAPETKPTAQRPFTIVSMVGGKWTTFRGFAEEVADMVLSRIGAARKTATQDLEIGGGHAFPKDAAARDLWIRSEADATGLTPERMDELLSRYGTTARQIARHNGAFSDADRLPDATDYSLNEIDFIVRNEQVGHLIDIVMRRTTLAITDALTLRDIAAIGEVAGKALGWDKKHLTGEIDGAVQLLRQRHMMAIAESTTS